jgi:hypothetical protein
LVQAAHSYHREKKKLTTRKLNLTRAVEISLNRRMVDLALRTIILSVLVTGRACVYIIHIPRHTYSYTALFFSPSVLIFMMTLDCSPRFAEFLDPLTMEIKQTFYSMVTMNYQQKPTNVLWNRRPTSFMNHLH